MIEGQKNDPAACGPWQTYERIDADDWRMGADRVLHLRYMCLFLAHAVQNSVTRLTKEKVP